MRLKFLKIFIILLSLVSFASAQQPDSIKKAIKNKEMPADSVSKKTTEKITSASKMKEKKEGFVDKNANGIDDRMEMGGKHGMKKSKGDIFIDKDGDGICDGRESAIGLKKIMRHRHRGRPPM